VELVQKDHVRDGRRVHSTARAASRNSAGRDGCVSH